MAPAYAIADFETPGGTGAFVVPEAGVALTAGDLEGRFSAALSSFQVYRFQCAHVRQQTT
jgi:hypothetical protein